MIMFFLSGYVLGHLCHDPFRPQEHLFLVPEKEQISIEETGEFRIYVENNFTSTLYDVRLIVKSEAFDIEVEPSIIEKLTPGQRTFFLISLKLREGYQPGNYSLNINVDAKRAEIRPSIEKIDIVAQKKIKTQQIEREPIIEQKEQIEIKPQQQPIIPLEEELKPQKVTPTPEKLQPKDRELKVQQKILETPPQQIKPLPKDEKKIVVKVEKKPFWEKPYFYMILIAILLGILIWRKIRR